MPQIRRAKTIDATPRSLPLERERSKERETADPMNDKDKSRPRWCGWPLWSTIDGGSGSTPWACQRKRSPRNAIRAVAASSRSVLIIIVNNNRERYRHLPRCCARYAPSWMHRHRRSLESDYLSIISTHTYAIGLRFPPSATVYYSHRPVVPAVTDKPDFINTLGDIAGQAEYVFSRVLVNRLCIVMAISIPRTARYYFIHPSVGWSIYPDRCVSLDCSRSCNSMENGATSFQQLRVSNVTGKRFRHVNDVWNSR